MNKKPYRPGPKRPSNATRPRGRNRQMGGKNDKDTNLINEEIRASEVPGTDGFRSEEALQRRRHFRRDDAEGGVLRDGS